LGSNGIARDIFVFESEREKKKLERAKRRVSYFLWI